MSDIQQHPRDRTEPPAPRPGRRAGPRRRVRARDRPELGFGLRRPGAAPIAVVPTPSENPAAGGGVASCLVYDPANLPTFDVVFDGTVTAIDGDQVTFEVNDGWKGADGSVTLTAPDADPALVGPLPAFEVGGRYLVSAAGSTINACGYTVDYDADTAAAWAAAFGG